MNVFYPYKTEPIEAHLEFSQASKMKPFAKLFNGFKPLTTSTKTSILDVWLGPGYASGHESAVLTGQLLNDYLQNNHSKYCGKFLKNARDTVPFTLKVQARGRKLYIKRTLSLVLFFRIALLQKTAGLLSLVSKFLTQLRWRIVKTVPIFCTLLSLSQKILLPSIVTLIKCPLLDYKVYFGMWLLTSVKVTSKQIFDSSIFSKLHSKAANSAITDKKKLVPSNYHKTHTWKLALSTDQNALMIERKIV